MNEDPVLIAKQFLEVIFEPKDWVLYRPIETWIENGLKKSRVDFKNTRHRSATPDSIEHTIPYMLRLSAGTLVNVFFGVCPRFADGKRFDLAWQIRTVRVLWIDIDHVTVGEALERVRKAGLPPPTIVVNSGNGVHLYWKLDTPYLIDDVGNPPPVLLEWPEKSAGSKKPRSYILVDGERVYLDKQKHTSRLSPKSMHLQDVLAGIAQACGGDHTTDLARLLRIPGSVNRKDQRNGREPVTTAPVSCDPSLVYPLSVFEAFAKPAPETERQRKIAAMPLPVVKKKVAQRTGDKLADKIAASAIATPGHRSEADFAVCCFAIANGVDKDYVWGLVENVGKFADSGRRYFDLTWENAEFETRTRKLDAIEKQASAPTAPSVGPPDDPAAEFSHLSCRSTINVFRGCTLVGDTLREMTGILLGAKNCFVRADQLIVIHGDQITSILSAAELAGLLSEHVEFYFSNDEGGEYKPLPPAYGNTWLNNRVEQVRIPAIKLFTRNRVYTEDWRLVAPGFDKASGIYYAGEAIEPREGTAHWDTLLRDFCFKQPADRTNYLGMALTAILIPRFIGAKPAVLFNGNQPGLGKSILAQVLSIVRDGRSAETVSYNPNDEEFEKRLGAGVRSGATTLIIDNAKGRGRDPRIESACLERSITDEILSFRLLGQSATIRTENSIIFCITANTLDISRDLVTRCTVVNLYHEGDPQRRNFSIEDPEGYAKHYRNELLGELIGMVERWKQSGQHMASTNSRFNKRGWGNIVGGILHACGEPDFLANAEEAATSLDESRREFAELVAVLAGHSQGVWKGSELVDLCAHQRLLVEQLGEGSTRSKATRLGLLAGRYVGERFILHDKSVAVFLKAEERNGMIYRVGIE